MSWHNSRQALLHCVAGAADTGQSCRQLIVLVRALMSDGLCVLLCVCVRVHVGDRCNAHPLRQIMPSAPDRAAPR